MSAAHLPPAPSTFDRSLAPAVLDSLGTGVAVLDVDGVVLDTNPAWQPVPLSRGDLLGVLQVGDDLLAACRHRPGSPDTPVHEHLAEGIGRVLAGRAPRFELQYELGDGEHARWYLLTATALPGVGAVVTRADTTVHHAVHDVFSDLAFHDHLTKLPNRWLVLDRLRMAIGRAARQRIWATVLFADLDRFKVINDTHGHAVGDEVLITTARRLAGAVRGEDTCGRWGGDEFVMVLELDDPGHLPIIIDRLTEAATRPVVVPGVDEPLQVGLSIGIAALRGETSADRLIELADESMYRAKSTHQATLCLVPPEGEEPTFAPLAHHHPS